MAKVFFAFPYAYDHSNPEFRVAFRQAAEAQGHQAVFADEVFGTKDILQHIGECIEECYAAFFDITGLNPNVLIELGIGYAAEKHIFLLLNSSLHVRELKSFWGARTEELDIPADLKGLVHLTYTDSHDLRRTVERALKQNPARLSGGQIATKIKEKLVRLGPLNMTGIASATEIHIDTVRPVLKNLVASQEVERLGNGRGTKYKVHH